jgi:PAS domain S-box-containing protein
MEQPLAGETKARSIARLLARRGGNRSSADMRVREELEQLRVILARVADGITVQDEDGRLVYANDAAARLTGLDSSDELLATPVAEVLRRFEILGEDGKPFPLDHLPGRRVLESSKSAEATLCYRIKATGEERWTIVQATPVFGPDGSVLAVNVFHDITERRRAEERARFMANASRLLNESLDYERTLAELGRLTVPALADFCLLDIVQDGGSLREIVLAHVDPEKEEILHELRRRYGVARNEAHPATRGLRSGKAVLIKKMTEEILAASAFDDEHLELYHQLDLLSYLVVPLVAHGRTLGTISLGTSASGHRYDEDDLLLVQELADRAATAVDNARVYREVERQARAVQALEFVGDGVALVDRSGIIRLWNPAAAAITGIPSDDVVGRMAAEAVPGWDDLAASAPVVGRSEGATARPRALPFGHGDREVWVSISGVAFDQGTVFAFRDVTEERLLDRLKSDFLATLSHELRPPLAAVYGAVRTLNRGGPPLADRDRSALMEMIENAAERLARIVDDILVAGQLEAGRLQLAVTRCDAAEVARAVVSAARLTAPERIDIDLVVPEPIHPVLANADKVSQVLSNLVENAVKYSPDGGLVVLRLEERRTGTLRLSVTDEGLGVPPSDRERIFEKFYRLDPNLTRGVRGSGLGLYVCRELLARMGGEIWFEPRSGKGSRFVVELPLAEVASG